MMSGLLFFFFFLFLEFPFTPLTTATDVLGIVLVAENQKH